MRIRLEYFDQNEGLASVLPRLGTVVRNLTLADRGPGWSLLSLDEPFEYGGRQHRHVLIRSRWNGHVVGDREPASVFILLARDGKVLDGPSASSDDVEHVGWGMAHALA